MNLSKFQYYLKKLKLIIYFAFTIAVIIIFNVSSGAFDKLPVPSSLNYFVLGTQTNIADTICDVIANVNSSSNENLEYSLEKFEEVLKVADINQMLCDQNKEFTVLAPSDDAFNSLSKAKLDRLLEPSYKESLQKILYYHIIPDTTLNLKDFKDDNSASMWTAEGSRIEIKVHKNSIEVKDAIIIQADLETSNGVIHVINKVIYPSGVK